MPPRINSSKEAEREFQSGRDLGCFGEDTAAEYLEARGLSVIARNFRSRFGEIDIIAKDGDTIVFVEVKTRSGRRFGQAIEQITRGKQRKIIKTAREYLRRSGFPGSSARFDELATDIISGEEKVIEHVKGAFDGWR